MCQCRFLKCNKGTLWWMVVYRGGCACVEAVGRWEISVPFAEFCCEP